MNSSMGDEYEEERLSYMWYVTYDEEEIDESPWGAGISITVPNGDYSQYWSRFESEHGDDAWISSDTTYDVEAVR